LHFSLKQFKNGCFSKEKFVILEDRRGWVVTLILPAFFEATSNPSDTMRGHLPGVAPSA